MTGYRANHLLTWLLAALLVFGSSMALASRDLPDFTRLVESNSPAVVNISTKGHRSPSNRLPKNFKIPELPEDSPFNDLFKHFFGAPGGPGGEEDGPEEFDTQSLGSGFIISSDGYVLTNNHVVNDADEILVRLSDRREFLAKVIGGDKRSDVALLKIEANDLPVVNIGSSKELRVGEWVLAIGSPFGFDHSVTAGIVSAKGRSLPNENYVPFIQTDVAINPGNSGGPLFNLDGRVVGINSQIYSRTGGFMGLSFAIPIEMAMNVADQLKNKGKVSRGWLGVLIQDVTRELADSFGMKYPKGALVAKVLPDSPAEKAGLQAGDIILKYAGHDIHRSSMLPPVVGTTEIGGKAEVLVLRGGKERKFQVRIGELPEEEELAGGYHGDNPEADRGGELGLAVAPISDMIQKQLKMERKRGVVVDQVFEGAAQEAGVRKGDVIQMINNQRVDSVDQYNKAVSDLPKGKTIAVLVLRRNGPMFLALKVPQE